MARPQMIDVNNENNEFQHLEVLKRNRTKRTQYREIFVEGVASINALLAAKWRIYTVAHSRQVKLSSWAQDVIHAAKPRKVLRLRPELMEKLSERANPSELIVIAERRERKLEDLSLSEDSTIVAFDRPSNHGNLGSIIRSSDAFGAGGVVTIGRGVDIFDPVVLRSSLGAFFALPVVHCEGFNQFERWIEHVRQTIPRVRVIGTDLTASKPLHEVDLTGPTIILLGNEALGLSHNLRSLTDENVIIPMRGTVDSINVACAATTVLYEMERQRMKSPR